MPNHHKYKVTMEVKGIIIGVRQVQDRGRIQIPKRIRDEMNLKDGDSVYWIKSPDGKYYIVKAVELEGKIIK